MEANQEDINSLFDCIVLSEDRLVEEGYEKGYKAGLKEGNREGERLGRQRGGKIGAEIGFYLGFVEQWKEVYQGNSGKKGTERVVVALNKLEEVANNFPQVNSKEELGERLDLVRAKFKLVCSLLKINSEFSLNPSSW